MAWVARAVRELRLAARRLWKAPAFTIPVVATLCVGLGVSTAMLGLMDALWFRPPVGVATPDQVVRLRFEVEDPGGEPTRVDAANMPLLDDLARSGAFDHVAGTTITSVSLGHGVDAVQGVAMLVTPGFFRVLGTHPARGTFDALHGGDGTAGVLAYEAWTQRFGADPHIIGKSIIVDNMPYVVAAIAPPGFSAAQTERIDVWLPISHAAQSSDLPVAWRDGRSAIWLSIVARLPEQVAAARAKRQADAVLSAGARTFAGTLAFAPTSVSFVPLRDQWHEGGPSESDVARWLAGLSLLVLLLACVNVANLLAARVIARRAEYVTRIWLGATQRHLRLSLLAEVVALTGPSVIAASLLEFAARRLIPRLVPDAHILPSDLLDSRVAIILGGVAFVAILTVALLVAWYIQRLDWSMQPGRPVVGIGTTGWQVRGTLIALQAALCVILLFYAGLFAESLHRVQQLDLGVALDRTIQVRFNLPRDDRSGERGRENVTSLYTRALEVVQQIPGVRRASLAEPHPYMMGRAVGPWTAERSQSNLWSKGATPFLTAVGAHFFTTVSARSLHGRDFEETDRAGAPQAVIVNAPLARRLWPDRAPQAAIGQCVWYVDGTACAEVVGVLDGVWKFNALDREQMVLYVPLAQAKDVEPGTLLLQAQDDPRALMPTVRRALQALRPDLRAISVERAADLVERDFRPWRLGATLFTAFGAIAAVLAGIGIYGVVAFTTRLRVTELGIRRALGASHGAIVQVVAREVTLAVLVGLVVGVGGAVLGGRWFGDLLYETSPRDPWILGATALALLAVALLAMLRPALLALRLSPSEVLREG